MNRRLTCPSCRAELLVPDDAHGAGTCPRCLAVIDTSGSKPPLLPLAPSEPFDQQHTLRAGTPPDVGIRTASVSGFDREIAGDQRSGLVALWVIAAVIVVPIIFKACVGGGGGGGIVNLEGIFEPFFIVGGIVFLLVFGGGLYLMGKSTRRSCGLAGGVFLFLLAAIGCGLIFGIATCTAIYQFHYR